MWVSASSLQLTATANPFHSVQVTATPCNTWHITYVSSMYVRVPWKYPNSVCPLPCVPWKYPNNVCPLPCVPWKYTLMHERITCCSVMQWVAVSCSELQWVAVSCSELQWKCTHIDASAHHLLQCIAVSCSELQWVAMSCSELQWKYTHIDASAHHDGARRRRLPNTHVAVWCSELQCVAVCCSVLQWVVVSCSELQWRRSRHPFWRPCCNEL